MKVNLKHGKAAWEVWQPAACAKLYSADILQINGLDHWTCFLFRRCHPGAHVPDGTIPALLQYSLQPLEA